MVMDMGLYLKNINVGNNLLLQCILYKSQVDIVNIIVFVSSNNHVGRQQNVGLE